MKRTLTYKRGIYTQVFEIIVLLAILSKEVQSNDQFHNRKWDESFSFQRPGPVVYKTHGTIWPKPQLQKRGSQIFFTLNPRNFSFKVWLTLFQHNIFYFTLTKFTINVLTYKDNLINNNIIYNRIMNRFFS